MLASLLDTAMDLAVVPGYTKVGYAARRALAWEDLAADSLRGRSVLVTGASSGIGLAAAEAMAGLGASLHLLVRDRERGERAAAQVAARGAGEVSVELADLSEMASVRAFATRFCAEHDRLDVLVNNAGVMTPERRVSSEGHELAYATNVLGGFLLTAELLPLLGASAPARVITVSSGGMFTARLDVEQLDAPAGADYDGSRAYARTKRAEVVLSELWAQRTAGTGVAFHSMHPGWADTPGIESSLPRFRRVTRPLLRSAAEGADTIVWLAAAAEPALLSGEFWHDRRARSTHRVPATRERPEQREALWRHCITDAPPENPRSRALVGLD